MNVTNCQRCYCSLEVEKLVHNQKLKNKKKKAKKFFIERNLELYCDTCLFWLKADRI